MYISKLYIPSKYRTRAIITRGLYFFYLIFHCGLYSRAVYIAERLVLQGNFSESIHLNNSSNVAKKKDNKKVGTNVDPTFYTTKK